MNISNNTSYYEPSENHIKPVSANILHYKQPYMSSCNVIDSLKSENASSNNQSIAIGIKLSYQSFESGCKKQNTMEDTEVQASILHTAKDMQTEQTHKLYNHNNVCTFTLLELSRSKQSNFKNQINIKHMPTTMKSKGTQSGQIYLRKNKVKIIKSPVLHTKHFQIQRCNIDINIFPPILLNESLNSRINIYSELTHKFTKPTELRQEKAKAIVNHKTTRSLAYSSYIQQSETHCNKIASQRSFINSAQYIKDNSDKIASNQTPVKNATTDKFDHSFNSFSVNQSFRNISKSKRSHPITNNQSRCKMHRSIDLVKIEFRKSEYPFAGPTHENIATNCTSREFKYGDELCESVNQRKNFIMEDNALYKSNECEIEWGNSLLYYNVKNGITDFNFDKSDDVLTVYEIDYISQLLKAKDEVIYHVLPYKQKALNTIKKLAKELCVPHIYTQLIALHTNQTYNDLLQIFEKAGALFKARIEIVTFLKAMAERELIINKDINYLIHKDHSNINENQQAKLIKSVNEVIELNKYIIEYINKVKGLHEFQNAKFYLNCTVQLQHRKLTHC